MLNEHQNNVKVECLPKEFTNNVDMKVILN